MEVVTGSQEYQEVQGMARLMLEAQAESDRLVRNARRSVRVHDLPTTQARPPYTSHTPRLSPSLS